MTPTEPSKVKRSMWPVRSKLFFLMLGAGVCLNAALFGVVSFFFAEVASSLESKGIQRNEIIFRMLHTLEMQLDWALFGVATTSMVVLLIVGLRLSHRLSGPMFNLTRHLNNLAATGDLTEVKFRKNDDFQEVAEAFNRFVASQRQPKSERTKAAS